MLLDQKALAFSGFLFQLLASGRELLFELSQSHLLLLLGLGSLGACLQQQLIALLARLLTHLVDLAFGFLADAGTVDQLLALALGCLEDVVGLVPCLADEVVLLVQQIPG
jgi:hypothetical protein